MERPQTVQRRNHLQIEIERFSWVETDQLNTVAVMTECSNNWLLHQTENAVSQKPAGQKPNEHAYDLQDNPFPQLLQTLKQRHGRLVSFEDGSVPISHGKRPPPCSRGAPLP